jgi:type II secretory pathway pseudopilin PulG
MSRCSAREAKGFTLVEVMVSLLIFMVASMVLLPLLMNGLQVNHDNSLRAQARRLAGEVMAELQVIDYARLAMAADESLLIAGMEIQQQVEQNFPQFDQSTITVTALWEKQGRSHRYLGSGSGRADRQPDHEQWRARHATDLPGFRSCRAKLCGLCLAGPRWRCFCGDR